MIISSILATIDTLVCDK